MAVGVQVEDNLSGKPIILNDHLCYRPAGTDPLG